MATTIKCLSLWEPWASLVVFGAKRYETRSWRTSYTGPVAIHASKTFKPAQRLLCEREPFHSALRDGGWYDRPIVLGAVLGVAELMRCDHTESILGIPGFSGSEEREFGDYSDRRWAWELYNPIRFERPVPLAGKVYLFDIETSILPEFRAI